MCRTTQVKGSSSPECFTSCSRGLVRHVGQLGDCRHRGREGARVAGAAPARSLAAACQAAHRTAARSRVCCAASAVRAAGRQRARRAGCARVQSTPRGRPAAAPAPRAVHPPGATGSASAPSACGQRGHGRAQPPHTTLAHHLPQHVPASITSATLRPLSQVVTGVPAKPGPSCNAQAAGFPATLDAILRDELAHPRPPAAARLTKRSHI